MMKVFFAHDHWESNWCTVGLFAGILFLVFVCQSASTDASESCTANNQDLRAVREFFVQTNKFLWLRRTNQPRWVLRPFVLLAQFDFDDELPPVPEPGTKQELKWPAKSVWIAIVFLAASLFGFNVLFKRFLGSESVWPRTAYGRTWAFAWAITFAVAIWFFWTELMGSPTSFWTRNGLRIGALAAGAFISFMILVMIRSRQEESSP